MTITQIAPEYFSYLADLLREINRYNLAFSEAYDDIIAIDRITFTYGGEEITEFRLVYSDDLGQLVLETGEDE